MGKWLIIQEHIATVDGSHTLYSEKYQQHFHDIDTGAIKESLTKHVIPALEFHEKAQTLRILDICFGIGYNTFSTIYYVLKHNIKSKLEIYSPELDEQLITSLDTFHFPQEFDEIKHIIQAIAKEHYYEDEKFKIEVKIGDAREYIKTLNNIDVIYQDAFSVEVNKELWSVEYFKDIYHCANENAIMTTYSVATNVRLSMFEAGFEIYEIKPVKKKQTLAFKNKQTIDAKYIDMILKQTRNKEAKALHDTINNK